MGEGGEGEDQVVCGDVRPGNTGLMISFETVPRSKMECVLHRWAILSGR